MATQTREIRTARVMGQMIRAVKVRVHPPLAALALAPALAFLLAGVRLALLGSGSARLRGRFVLGR